MCRSGPAVWATATCNLDQQSKRAVTICNLFVNHACTISDIVRRLDEGHTNVVLALLEQRTIREWKTKPMAPPDGTKRRKSVSPKAKSVERTYAAFRRVACPCRRSGCRNLLLRTANPVVPWSANALRNQFPIHFAKVVQKLLNRHRFQRNQFNRLVLPDV
jgi:hypothetical protein